MSAVLIVGGLTIDRFADGSAAPGGSVLHAGRAARAEGSSLTTLTVAGDEREARDGLAMLAGLGRVVRQRASSTVAFRHGERDGVRVLRLEARADPIGADGLADLSSPDVALVAPIADEVPPALVDSLRSELRPRCLVLLIQGWLRHLEVGQEVTALPLGALSADQSRVVADADAIVVSTEDLVEAPGDPFAQAAALRAALGPRPVLLLTLGIEGYLLDDPSLDRVVASVPRRVVTGVSAVGAGDTFGASVAVNLARGARPQAAADLATERVIEVLESRR